MPTTQSPSVVGKPAQMARGLKQQQDHRHFCLSHNHETQITIGRCPVGFFTCWMWRGWRWGSYDFRACGIHIGVSFTSRCECNHGQWRICHPECHRSVCTFVRWRFDNFLHKLHTRQYLNDVDELLRHQLCTVGIQRIGRKLHGMADATKHSLYSHRRDHRYHRHGDLLHQQHEIHARWKARCFHGG